MHPKRFIFNLGSTMLILGSAFVLTMLLIGCASTNQSMSAEQINAATKDKSASCIYAKIAGVWGTAETVVVGYDQKTIINGSVAVGDKCSTLDVKDAKVETVACAMVSLERAPDGSCNEVRRDAQCRTRSATRVDPGRCPTP